MSWIFTPSTDLLQLIHTYQISVWHFHQVGPTQGHLPAANQNEGLNWPIGISHFGWFLLANQVPHFWSYCWRWLIYQDTTELQHHIYWPSLTFSDRLWPFSDHSPDFLPDFNSTVTMAVTLSRSQLVLKKIKFVEGAYFISYMIFI